MEPCLKHEHVTPSRSVAVATTTMALSIIVGAVIIAASIFSASYFGTMTTVTRTNENVITSTVATTLTVGSSCSAASSLQGLPSHGIPWFTAGVNYSGYWNATVVAYSSTFLIFTRCYTGNGPGYFEIVDWNPNGTAMIKITATKLDGGTRILSAAVNGNTSSTSTPYGSVVVSASIMG